MSANFERRALTGPLSQFPDGAMIRLWAALGLVSAQGAWQEALQRSGLATMASRARQAIADASAPYRGTSWAARLAPFLSIASLVLLLLASPYVGTGMNALLVLVSFAACTFQFLVDPPFDHAADALDWPFLAFLAVSVMAVGFSPNLLLSVKGLAKMLVFWMSFFAFRGALRRGERAWVPLFLALFVAAGLESLYGIYQWKIHVAPLALWDDPDAENKITRVYGSLKNPNLLAGYLIPVIPFAAAAALTWRNWLLKLISLGTLLTAPLALYFTYSRGAYLGLAAEGVVFVGMGLVTFWPTIRRKPWMMGLLGVLVVLGLGAIAFAFKHSPALQERVLSITATRTHSSNSFRMNVWIAVKHMIRDSWWAGIGLGNDAFRRVYALYMVSGFEALGAYKIFLEEAAEKGVFGLLAFLWLLITMVSRACYHFARNEQRAWAIAAIASLLGLSVHGLVDTVFYRPSVQILFWLTLAVILHLPHRERGAA